MSGSDVSQRPAEAPDRDAAETTLLTAEAFVDRVMAAVAVAQPPTPTRTFLSAIRAARARDAVAALSVAWHLGTVRSWPVAPRVRARSMALVLAVASVLATGSLVAAAAVRIVAPQIERAPAAEPGGSGVDEQGPVMNEPIGTDERGQTNDAGEAPNSTDESDETVDGQPATDGDGPVEADDDDSQPDGGDQPDDADDGDHDPGSDDESNEADDGEGGTDGADGPDEADDGDDEEPDEAPDGDDGPTGDDEPDETDDGEDGSSDRDDGGSDS